MKIISSDLFENFTLIPSENDQIEELAQMLHNYQKNNNFTTSIPIHFWIPSFASQQPVIFSSKEFHGLFTIKFYAIDPQQTVARINEMIGIFKHIYIEIDREDFFHNVSVQVFLHQLHQELKSKLKTEPESDQFITMIIRPTEECVEDITEEEALNFKAFVKFMKQHINYFILRLQLPTPEPVDIPLHLTNMKKILPYIDEIDFGNNPTLFEFCDREGYYKNYINRIYCPNRAGMKYDFFEKAKKYKIEVRCRTNEPLEA